MNNKHGKSLAELKLLNETKIPFLLPQQQNDLKSTSLSGKPSSRPKLTFPAPPGSKKTQKPEELIERLMQTLANLKAGNQKDSEKQITSLCKQLLTFKSLTHEQQKSRKNK